MDVNFSKKFRNHTFKWENDVIFIALQKNRTIFTDFDVDFKKNSKNHTLSLKKLYFVHSSLLTANSKNYAFKRLRKAAENFRKYQRLCETNRAVDGSKNLWITCG